MIMEDCSYSCFTCGSDLCLHQHLLSTSYLSAKGKAFLFSHVKNVVEGPQKETNMISGKYIASDIFCNCCSTKLGWRYQKAFIDSQKFKEGKFVLSKSEISKICASKDSPITLHEVAIQEPGYCIDDSYKGWLVVDKPEMDLGESYCEDNKLPTHSSNVSEITKIFEGSTSMDSDGMSGFVSLRSSPFSSGLHSEALHNEKQDAGLNPQLAAIESQNQHQPEILAKFIELALGVAKKN